MSWRDCLPPDKLLTDEQLLDMMEVSIVQPDSTFDSRYLPRAADLPELADVTLERVLVHHATLVSEIERLRSELHASHTMVTQSYYTSTNVKPGWMICILCKYEFPSSGHCDLHQTLDGCWASK